MKNILWIPTPPSYGSVSMQRYFQVMLDEDARHREEDRSYDYNVRSLVPFTHLNERSESRGYRAFDKWVRFPVKSAVAARSVDLVHAISHGSGHILPFVGRKVKTLSTVHDLIQLKFNDGLSPGQFRRFEWHMRMLRKSHLLAAISEATATDIHKLLGIDHSKIVVNYLGIDAQLFSKAVSLSGRLERLGSRPYILNVSNLSERKNLKILPSVLRELKRLGECPALVRVGPDLPLALRQEICEVIGEKGLIELGFCDDGELISLYQHAKVFFFPSLYEGFGLPVLEAMAASCPVVCTDGSSLPEVGGDAALYFDPESSREAAQQLKLALNDGADFIKRGHKNVAKFSWRENYNRTLASYDELLR